MKKFFINIFNFVTNNWFKLAILLLFIVFIVSINNKLYKINRNISDIDSSIQSVDRSIDSLSDTIRFKHFGSYGY